MKDVEKTDDDLDPPKPGVSKIVLGLLVLNLGVAGFSAFKVMTMPPPVAASDEAPKVESDVPGPLHSFEPFVVNLNDVENPRFLKITVDAELVGPDVEATLDETHIRIARDASMRYLSSLTLQDVMGEKAKNDISDALVARLNKSLGAESVKRVLFAEFVVQ